MRILIKLSPARHARLARNLLLAAACGVAGCSPAPKQAEAQFPVADRPVAQIISDRWSTEESRDRLDEAERIMDLADIQPGMTVADIGAGEGYYTIRLSERVGPKGRVLAQDIMPAVRDKLAERVNRERLDNVSVRLGAPQDPRLPPASFDRVLMVHMYHEIAAPYQFLWNLHPALKPGGRVIIVDADRPTEKHGTPPLLLQCELAAIGYNLVRFERAAFAGGYYAAFEVKAPRPAPADIKPCSRAISR